jgi:hypothetical protein
MRNNNKKLNYKITRYINQSRYLESEFQETESFHEEYQDIFNNDFKHELDIVRKKNVTKSEKEKKEFIEKMKEEGHDIDEDILYEEYMNNLNDNENKTVDDINDKLDAKLDEELNKKNNSLYYVLLKKIYRKLAIETHPDKNSGKKSILFYKVEKYYNNKNLLDLLIIASDFDINIIEELDKATINIIKNNEKSKDDMLKEKDNILKDLFQHFEECISNKTEKIENIKKSVAWSWGSVDDLGMKMKIRDFLYKMWDFTQEEITHLNNIKSPKNIVLEVEKNPLII